MGGGGGGGRERGTRPPLSEFSGVNQNTFKTTRTWMNVWKSLAESKGFNAKASTTTLSNTKVNNWTNVSRASLPKFAKAMAPITSQAA